ncbi:MAG: serine/threonine protein kinase [Betaproteobacteria bacterium]|nr:MAG: serine/threonine protein kinase [Betaproteobacteria bacterium]
MPGVREARPYDGLTPDVVLDALDSAGLRGDGRLLALNSFENRVYQVSLEDGGSVVAKFYRPQRWSDAQILEEHAFALELAAREIPVVAPLALAARTLHTHAGFRFAAYPRCGGRPPELEDESVLEWIGRFLARIHGVGAAAPFHQRPALDIDSFGVEPRDWLLAHDCLPPDLRQAWESVADQAIDGVRDAWQRAGTVQPIRLHGDCHAGNILWTEADARRDDRGGPHFVDLDDARSGPAVQDLWMLLPGDRATAEKCLRALLRGYEQLHAFDRRELLLLEALRTLRLLHYAYWIARRWDDPAFPAAFPWFGTQRYWQDRILELREQVPAMQEPPLAC